MRPVRFLIAATCIAGAFGASRILADAPSEATAPPATTAAPEGTVTALPEAPFGLQWLESKQDLAEMGISLKTPIAATDFGESYVVSRLPKELPDFEYAVLSFGYNDRLIRILAVGTGFVHDEDGSRIKPRYEELERSLEKKYGPGKSEVHIDKDYDGNKFELGIRLKKNWMYAEFSPPDLYIQLSALEDIPRMRWRIIFEYIPGMERLKHDRKKAEERAL
jgi:hypothetical protein